VSGSTFISAPDAARKIQQERANLLLEGTARDVSLLIDYLPSFIFPNSERRVSENLVLGVSLGGHAAWSCLLHEPRISAGVVIIGCPDYVNVMADRARLSKLPSWTNSDPPGSQFLGSEAFPWSLLDTVRKYDPASLFLSRMDRGSELAPLRNPSLPQPSEKEKEALRPLLSRCLAGKKILNLSGGVDKLVPYHAGKAFLTWLKEAIAPGGWFSDDAVVFEDIIDEKAAHEATPKMVNEAVRFISETLATSGENSRAGFVRDSKI
jgi:pimeloyl-ACP methyl ester carboxylesterase